MFNKIENIELPEKSIYGFWKITDEEFEMIKENRNSDIRGECGMEEDEMEHHEKMTNIHGYKNEFNNKEFIITENSKIYQDEIKENKLKCAITECGNPKIRDLYAKDNIKRNIYIDWLYIKSDENWKNAINTARIMTHFLNRVYKVTGFYFTSRVHIFNLTKSLANKLGVKSVNELYNMRVHKFDCSEREDKNYTNGTICIEAHKLMIALRGKKWQELGAFQLIPVIFTRDELNGFGKFPWSKDHGMLIISHHALVKGATTLPHEMGHCLGLLHTFSGWDPNKCHACSETNPNGDDFTGDLISDTPPMPQWQPMENLNTCYSNPDPKIYPSTCIGSWKNTPNTNIMSYGTCRFQITPQQINRMKCFADRIIKNKFWKEY
jgi:hypothetical protein